METSTIFIFIGFTVVASLAIAALIQINGNDWVDGNKLKDNGEFTMKTLDILEEITSNTKISLKVEDIKSTHGPIKGGGVCALVYDQYKAYRYTTGNKVKYEITVPLEGLALPGPSSRIIGVCTGDGNFDKSAYILTFPENPGIITNLRMTCQDGPCTGNQFIRQISLGVSGGKDGILNTNMYKNFYFDTILDPSNTNRALINQHKLVTPTKSWDNNTYNNLFKIFTNDYPFGFNNLTLLAGFKSDFWLHGSTLENDGTCQVAGDNHNLFGINDNFFINSTTTSLYLYSDMGFCGSTTGTCENGKFYPFTSGQFFIEFETVRKHI